MKTCDFTIKGFTPYSPSRPFQTDPRDGEGPDDRDIRCWREHAHTDADGLLVIPGRCFKQAFDFAAKRLSLKKKGQSTWTADITSGIDVFHDVPIFGSDGKRIHIDDVQPVMIYAHLNGDRSSGSRGYRRFPIVPAPWSAHMTVHVINDTIPDSVVERVIAHAGLISGVGRFRPEKAGSNGRFAPVGFRWAPWSMAA